MNIDLYERSFEEATMRQFIKLHRALAYNSFQISLSPLKVSPHVATAHIFLPSFKTPLHSLHSLLSCLLWDVCLSLHTFKVPCY